MNAQPPPLGSELDIRSLRYFVAVAEDLNFTTAAARLFVAQQAVSREIRVLERRLGTRLFARTTRRVTLTPDGARLLEQARELIALHDRIWTGMAGPSSRPCVVDLLSEGRLTGARILEAARLASPHLEFRGRYGGGAGAALDRLRAGELDIVLARLDWLDQAAMAGVERRLIRLEPMAVLLPAGHPLAALDRIPFEALRGHEIDANAAHANAPEWTDYVRQFLALAGARATAPHVPAIGLDEQGYHLVRQGLPILTGVDHVEVPGGVVRPIVDPVPLYPWSMAWRVGAEGEALDAFRSAAAGLARGEGWLGTQSTAADNATWLPLPDATRLADGELDPVTAGTVGQARTSSR